MNGVEFLEYAGMHYEENRRKWAKRLGGYGLEFSDDIFNDTVLKVFDSLSSRDYDGDVESYWYMSFLNNSRRDTRYSYHNRDESIDVLKYLDEFPYEEPTIYKSMFSAILNKEDDNDFQLFRMYYLCPDLSYDDISDLTGVKSVRSRIKRIRDRMNVESYSYRDI